MNDKSLIRGTALQGFPELVAELGGSAADLLAAVNLPRAAVGNPDAFISYRKGMAALELAAERTTTPDFGRQLALRQGVEILGPVGVAVRTAPTVGAALQALDQYLSVYSPAISARIDPQPGQDHARFEFRILLERPGPHRQAEELALGVVMQIFRLIIGPDFRPVAVDLPHEAMTPAKDYVRYFGCTVRFAEASSGLIVRRSDLARPVSSDGAMHDVVREYLSSIALPAEGHLIEAVRLMVRRMLPTGGLEIVPIASQLGLHPRTLQRHLASQGTSFAAVVDGVRKEQLEHFLRDTDLTFSHLAGVLGYSEQSVLSRSCQRWFGMSPSTYRRNMRSQLAR